MIRLQEHAYSGWRRHSMSCDEEICRDFPAPWVFCCSSPRAAFDPGIAVGSYLGFAAVAGMLPFLSWRLLDEERFLAENLLGYAEYQRRVGYRLLPFVW